MMLSNPFATRAVRPGAIDYVFAHGQNLLQLIERFEANGRRGQIVGPHGSGKSTLLATFLAAYADDGRKVIEFSLHDGQRRLPKRLATLPDVDADTILVVDGYEQLSLWNRFLLNRFCNKRRCGLIVTAHESVGLPEIFRTTTSLEMTERIVEQLLPEGQMTVTRADVQQTFVAHGGNLREVFFELYDLYERRRHHRKPG